MMCCSIKKLSPIPKDFVQVDGWDQIRHQRNTLFPLAMALGRAKECGEPFYVLTVERRAPRGTGPFDPFKD